MNKSIAKTPQTGRGIVKNPKTPKSPAKGKRAATIQLRPKGPAGAGLLLAAVVGLTGILGYFGYKYYKKRKAGKGEKLADELLKIKLPVAPVPGNEGVKPPKTKMGAGSGGGKASGASGGFPLSKGSKGVTVRRMQQALMEKYGKSVLPNYGADGDFGQETATGLKQHGLPATIDESTFNVIIKGTSAEGAAETSKIVNLAEKLYQAAIAQKLDSVLSLLKSITDKDGYQQASNSFMQYRVNGVRQTLVNGLLNSFASESQKQQIRMEFLRMGLQYNGDKWSLSGFGGRAIVTIAPATVWASSTETAKVPANMALGTEIARKMDFTLFENNRKYFLVKSTLVKYLD
jgi:hypothetical protein